MAAVNLLSIEEARKTVTWWESNYQPTDEKPPRVLEAELVYRPCHFERMGFIHVTPEAVPAIKAAPVVTPKPTCGGESGSKRRPMSLAWAYSLKEQCEESGTAFFMKQIDKVIQIPDDLLVRQFPEGGDK